MKYQEKLDQRKMFRDALGEQILRGDAPWQKPRDSSFRMPFNPLKGEEYHPYNGIVLLVAAETRGYSDPRWLPIDDAVALGAQIKPNERGTMIEKWEKFTRVPQVEANGNLVFDEKTGKQKFEEVPLDQPRLVEAWVFNAEQFEGLEAYVPIERPPFAERLDALAGQLEKQGEVEFAFGEVPGAYYAPGQNKIFLPDKYPNKEAMYADLLKTLGQWAGDARRLDLSYYEAPGTPGHALDEARIAIYGMMASSRYGIPHNPKAQTEAAREMAAATLLGKADQVRWTTNEAVSLQNKVQFYDQSVARSRGNVQHVTNPITQIVPVRPLKAVPGHEELASAAKEIGVSIEGVPVLDGKPQKTRLLTGEEKGVYEGTLEGGLLIATIRNEVTGEVKPFVQKGYHLGVEEKAAILSDSKAILDAKNQEKAIAEEARAKVCEQKLNEAKKLKESDKHPFLEKMKIQCEGLFVSGGRLLIPAHDVNGKVWSYQSISEVGQRHFPLGTRTKGMMHLIGGKADELKSAKTIYISESFEAGKTIHETTGKPVAVAFRSQNLQAVASEIKRVSPNVEIVVFGERSPADPKRDAEQLKFTSEAVRAVDAKVVHPMDGMTCFNDTMRLYGREIVSRVISNIEQTLKRTPEKAAPARESREPSPQKKRSAGQER